MAGIYELYYRDEKQSLRLICLAKAWYGGLRTSIREKTDPELTLDAKWKKILSDFSCYYRYSVLGSHLDMLDILFFFASRYFPNKSKMEDSGRYVDIYVEEKSDDKIVDI